MIILLKLLLAHLVGDFLLQPKSWVEEKEIKKSQSLKLYYHVLIHAFLALFALGTENWHFVLGIAGSHGVIDALKLHSQSKKTKTDWFILDQLLHLTVILIVWVTLTENQSAIQNLLVTESFYAYLVAILFLTRPSSILMSIFMRPWSKQLSPNNEDSLANAGTYIGILERLFVFCFIVNDHWEAVGFLLTAKSVFRFGDLKKSKERKLTEYVLIGTMLSFGLAVVVGLMVCEVLT